MAGAVFRKPPIKQIQKDGFLGVDMHFHTQYSMDGVSRISSVIKKARKKGFGFAVTDHNTIKGYLAAIKSAKDLLIIPGIEITCSNGNHVLAYTRTKSELVEFFDKFLKPRMKSNPFFADVSAEEIQQNAKDYNLIVGAPHPFSPGACAVMRTKPTKKVQKGFKIIEGINGYNFRKANNKAVMWAAELNKPMTGGSDAHTTYELAKVLTFTQAQDVEDMFKEVFKNKVFVIGKEDNVLLKAAMLFRKQGAYVNRSSKHKMAKQLLKSQLGIEYTYLKDKFKNTKTYNMFKKQHGYDDAELLCD